MTRRYWSHLLNQYYIVKISHIQNFPQISQLFIDSITLSLTVQLRSINRPLCCVDKSILPTREQHCCSSNSAHQFILDIYVLLAKQDYMKFFNMHVSVFSQQYPFFSDEEAGQVEMILFIYALLCIQRLSYHVILSPNKLSERTSLILLHHTNYVKLHTLKKHGNMKYYFNIFTIY